MVRNALQDALPTDHVATYDARKGFAPSDASAVEFFRRAKLVVVADQADGEPSGCCFAATQPQQSQST